MIVQAQCKLMSQGEEDLYQKWVAVQSADFDYYEFPIEKLGRILFEKVVNRRLDVGACFGIDTQEDPTLIYTGGDGRGSLTPGCDVFITDHCWLPEPEAIYREWREGPLKERLSMYLENPTPSNPLPPTLKERLQQYSDGVLELDDLEVTELEELNLPLLTPPITALSLWGCPLSNPADLLQTLMSLPELKALWINETPLDDDQTKEAVLISCPGIEILNSTFTQRYGSWALSYVAKNFNQETVTRLDLSDRGITELKKEAFAPFKNLTILNIKGNDVDLSSIQSIIPSLTSLYCDNPPAIDFPVFVNGVDKTTGDVATRIPDRIWDHIQPCGTRWGLGDEVYLAIHPSTNPNFAAMPVFNPTDGLSYCAFWPIATVQPGDEATANMYPLVPYASSKPLPPPSKMISLQSKFKSSVPTKRPIKVYCDVPLFAAHLTSPHFEVVNNAEDADLHWIGVTSVEDFKYYYENKVFVSQVENQTCLTMKDNLYKTVIEYKREEQLVPETFILTDPEEFTRFVCYDQVLRATNQSAVWMVKAFNQTRAALMMATESVGEVLRLATTGPRLAQRYIANPLTIFKKKFDLRFIVLLKSVKPLELFAYKVFWPRLAPKEWALEDFSDYERHFTVMNYKAPEKVTSKTWEDFVTQFAVEHPDCPWDSVLARIYDTIYQLFECGCQKMVASPFTKGMFGIDLMLTRDMKPLILECNFAPDCNRACNLCPTFVNDLFEVMFIEQPVTNDKVVQLHRL